LPGAACCSYNQPTNCRDDRRNGDFRWGFCASPEEDQIYQALSKAFGSPRFKYPALAILILAVVVLFYYLPATHRNQALLVDRGFRILANVADQVRNRIDIYSSIMGQTSHIDPPKRAAYLAEQVPDVVFVVCAEPPAPAHETGPDSTSLARWDKPESFDILFRYHSGPKPQLADKADNCAAARFDLLMAPLAPAGTFDEVILADDDGTVLFETARSGMRVTNIAPLFRQADSGKAAAGSDTAAPASDPLPAGAQPASPAPERNSGFVAAAKTSSILPVQLAGDTYQAFLVPVALRLTRSDAVAADTAAGARLVLCGLMTQSHYQIAITPFSGPAIIAIALLSLVIVIGSWPILKFTQMRATETIERRTGLHYAAMMACAMTFLVMLAIHVSYLFRDTDTDPRLEQLSKALQGNFQTEVQRSLAMLNAVERRPEFLTAPAGRVAPGATCRPGQPAKDPDTHRSWFGNTLATSLPLAEYPYFDHVFWADRAGYQELKWSVHKTPTPDKNVCSYDFFQASAHGQLWRFASAGGDGPQFRVDPLLSPNTGRYVGVITQAMPVTAANRGLSVVGVVTPLMSLVDPVLPPEYGFAIVDPSGLVLFHSRSEKNGIENFFHASQDDPTLLALVATRKPDWTTLYYLGVTHRAYVTPMSAVENCPWTLIAFRDLTLREAQVVERMTLFAFLSILYLAVIAAMAQAVPLPVYPPRWLWPSRVRVGRYRHLSVVLALMVYAYYRLTFLVSGPSILVAAVVVPAGAIALVILHFRAMDRWIIAGVLTVWVTLILAYATRWGEVSHWQKLIWASLLCGAALSLCFRSLTAGFAGRWLRPAAGKGAWSRISRATARALRVRDVSTSYSLVALGVLLLAGALPCIGFFRIAYDYCAFEFTRRAAMSTAAAMEQRACSVSAQYDSVQFSGPVAPDPELERTARWLFLRRRLETETLDRYDTVFLGLDNGLIRARSDTDTSSMSLGAMLPGIAARLPVWYVPQQPSSGGSSGCLTASWTPQPEGLNRLRLRLNTADAGAGSPEMAGLKQYLAGDSLHISQDLQANLDFLKPAPFLDTSLPILGIGIAAFFLLRATIRRLFLTGFQAEEPWPEIHLAPGLKIDRNLILIGLPFSGKTGAFAGRNDVHMIDLAAMLRGDGTVPFRVSEPIVVLDHFAFFCNDPAATRRKLELVERFVFKDRKIVVILTTIDPLFYVEAGTGVGARPSLVALAPGEEMDRWTKALVTFATLEVAGSPPASTPSYHRILWSTCTQRERIALYQLANEGWANCKNQAALQHLLKRGLIAAGPEFRIRDEDFAAFIRTWVSSEDQREWARQDEISSWDGLKAALVVSVGLAGGAIALLYGQQAIGYVVAGVSAISPVIKTLTDLRGKNKPGAAEA
jgi:hypothetical protein